jgi:hypothetical protein
MSGACFTINDEMTMTNNAIEIARACYEAYVKKDRAAPEALPAEDFHAQNLYTGEKLVRQLRDSEMDCSDV